MSKDNLYTITNSEITMNEFDEEVRIIFFGDIHRDAVNCDEDRWKYFLKKAKETHDGRQYYFGMGDYTDMASFNERKKIKNDGLHETTIEALDMLAERNNRKIAAEMSFMSGHILGLIRGNHGWRFENGKTSDEDLCERLKTQDLGCLTNHFIRFKLPGNRVTILNIAACHGLGGGKLLGTSLNKVNDLKIVFPAADIYAMGHDHQRFAVPSSAIFPEYTKGFKLKQKRQWLVRSGSFQKSYDEDTSSFSISRLMRPADMGVVTMKVSFHRSQKNKFESIVMDIKADY